MKPFFYHDRNYDHELHRHENIYLWFSICLGVISIKQKTQIY